MLVHRRVNPSIKLADTHLYTWGGERKCESKVKCHDAPTLNLAVQSSVEHTNPNVIHLIPTTLS